MKTFRSFSLFTLTLLAVLPALADTTVTPRTTGNGQADQVVDPGQVTTTEHATTVQVQVLSGGKAVYIGGTSVVLKPGFRAESGSLFRASQDLNLGSFGNLADSDFDGLPDAWELLHFGNLTSATGTGDADGDGVSNADEYRAGTNPNLNESTATTLPASAQVVLKMPTGKFQKVLTDWSIIAAP